MKIAQISDCHLFADLSKRGYNDIDPYHSLQQVIKKVSSSDVNLIAITGDITNDYSAKSYAHLDALLQQFCTGIPVVMIPGNHDDAELMRLQFPSQWCVDKVIELDQYWNLYGLNSQSTGAKGYVSDAQLELMHQNIATDPNKHWLVAVHHHPIECQGWMDKHGWTNSQAFIDKTQQLAQIKVIIYGHIHQVCETRVGAADFLSCPSTCWQWKNSQSFGISNESPGFRLINLMPDGRFQSEVFRL